MGARVCYCVLLRVTVLVFLSQSDEEPVQQVKKEKQEIASFQSKLKIFEVFIKAYSHLCMCSIETFVLYIARKFVGRGWLIWWFGDLRTSPCKLIAG